MRKKQVENEMVEESEVYRDFLYDVVPINRLAETFDVACGKLTSDFAPNAFALKNAWQGIRAEEIAAEEKQRVVDAAGNPALLCVESRYHVGDKSKGEQLSDVFQIGRDEIHPCPACRPSDFANWKKTNIALYGEVPRTYDDLLESIKTAPKTSIFAPKPEETLSLSDAAKLRDEYNTLVCLITTDDATQQMQMVIFDEGANVFKHRNRNDKLYSAKDLRREIERYTKILEGEK